MNKEQELSAILLAANTAVLDLVNFRSHSIDRITDQLLFAPDGDLDDSIWCDRNEITSLIENVGRIFSDWKDNFKRAVNQTLSLLKEAEPEFVHAYSTEKSRFFYLYGKALNALPEDFVDELNDENKVCSSFEAIQWLTRALKFNPQFADAWCELGESCWRQGNATEAIRHFKQALKIVPNHVDALCELSMALRQLPSSELTSTGSLESTKNPLSESLRIAHEAVRHEPTNGRAWTVLGNALLTTFFESFASVAPPPPCSRTTPDNSPSESVARSTSQLIMSRCVAAYALAVKDKSAMLEQSLHYNRGIAWHYQDKFAESLRSWLRAMCLDPQWPAPRVIALRLVEFIIHTCVKMNEMVNELSDCSNSAESTRLKEFGGSEETRVGTTNMVHLTDLLSQLSPCLSLNKKLSNEGTDLSSPESKCLSSSQCSSLAQLLGPYFASVGGDLTVCNSRSSSSKKKKKLNRSFGNPLVPLSSKLQFSMFNDLKTGSNRDKICVGRVVRRLPSDTELAMNLFLVDAQCTPLVVRLYNVGKGLGPDHKDILAIPHPFVEHCEVKICLLRAALMVASSFGGKDSKIDALLDELETLKTDQVSFRVLRIPIPDVLVVNGQPIGSSWTAAPVLKNIFFTSV